MSPASLNLRTTSMLVVVSALLLACGGGEAQPDATATVSEEEPADAGAADRTAEPEEAPDADPDADPDTGSDADEEADVVESEDEGAAIDEATDAGDEDGQREDDRPLHRDLDPELVARDACEAVSLLASYGQLESSDIDGEATLGGVREELELQLAMMEVAHPDVDLEGRVALRMIGLKLAEANLGVVDADPDAAFSELPLSAFGRAFDALGNLVAVEDAGGDLQFILSDPWYEDPTPLIDAGCDSAEVEAVAGRTLPELFGLGWMAVAQGPRPGPLPILDIVGTGRLVTDPSLPADSPLRECPLENWTDEVEIVGLGTHLFGVSIICTGGDGIDISVGLSASTLLADLGDDPTITPEGVAVSGDGQVVALVSTDGVTASVATPAPGAQVSTQQLVDAVIAAQP